MALIRWSPFGNLNRFGRDFDSLFNGHIWNEAAEGAKDWSPHVDIYDEETQIILSAELPGLTQEEISVDIDKNILMISGERKMETNEQTGNFTRRERYFGSFSRSFQLPETVNQENIEASMDKGVLKIVLPKLEQAKPKQIKVKVN